MFVTLENISEDIKVVREILTGNGDTNKGLVVRVAKLETQQKYCSDSLREHIDEIKADLKAIQNRKTKSNSKILGFLPTRVAETLWMWIVRGVIVVALGAYGWICGNSDDLGWILDKGKQMKQEELTK